MAFRHLKNDLVQRSEQALQAFTPLCRESLINLPPPVLSSFHTRPFPSGSQTPPVSRPIVIPITGTSCIEGSRQSRDLVASNYLDDGRLSPSWSAITADTLLPDYRRYLQEEPIDGQATADCNDGSQESWPDDASEDLDVWRENFLVELINLPHAPSKEDIVRRVEFFDCSSGMTEDEVNLARKPYERVCYR